jgi:hypothetical protein
MTTTPPKSVAFSTAAELPFALVIRQTRSAAPIETEAVAKSAPFTSRAVTLLTIVFATRPDRCAVITIAISVSALAIFHAGPIRYVLGPGSGRTVVTDRPIERGERPNGCRMAHDLSRISGESRRRCPASSVFDTPSAWHRLARRAGGHSGNAQHCKKAQKGESPMHPIRLHRHGSAPASGGIRPGEMLKGLSKRMPH